MATVALKSARPYLVEVEGSNFCYILVDHLRRFKAFRCCVVFADGFCSVKVVCNRLGMLWAKMYSEEPPQTRDLPHWEALGKHMINRGLFFVKDDPFHANHSFHNDRNSIASTVFFV